MNILGDYTDIKYANLDASNFLIADKENRRYQVVTMGWDKDVFIHDCPIHLDIINDKIWIQQNNTELDLAEILVEKGVDRSEIVLGFLSPKLREYTDYAVV